MPPPSGWRRRRRDFEEGARGRIPFLQFPRSCRFFPFFLSPFSLSLSSFATRPLSCPPKWLPTPPSAWSTSPPRPSPRSEEKRTGRERGGCFCSRGAASDALCSLDFQKTFCSLSLIRRRSPPIPFFLHTLALPFLQVDVYKLAAKLSCLEESNYELQVGKRRDCIFPSSSPL